MVHGTALVVCSVGEHLLFELIVESRLVGEPSVRLFALERHARQHQGEQVPEVVVGEQVDFEIPLQCRQLGGE